MSNFKSVFAAARSSDAYWVGRVKFQVAAALQDLLENSGLTQEKLAEKVGVKAPQVSRALSGGNNTTLESLAKMGFALGHVPCVTFVPVDSKAEAFRPAFQLNAQVHKKQVRNLYSFDRAPDVEPEFHGEGWNITTSSNDQRFALAA